MKKKILRNSLLILVILLLTGCGKKNVEIINGSDEKTAASDNPAYNINVLGSGTLSCTRNLNASSGLEATGTYTVKYEKGIILNIHSIEKVKGDNQDALDEFEDAYNKFKSDYSDVKYYDITVTRDENSVIYDANINYEKINKKKLFAHEGGEDEELYTDGDLVLKKWLPYVKKVGTTCKGV